VAAHAPVGKPPQLGAARLDQKIQPAAVRKLDRFTTRLGIANGCIGERHNFRFRCWYPRAGEKYDTNKNTNKSSDCRRLWQDTREQI
jgi:hypothetical protein